MTLNKLLSATALGVALTCGSGAASAALLPFCVNDAVLGGVGALGPATACAGQGDQTGQNGFAVDLFQGAYVEKLLVTAFNPVTNSGNFQATIVFDVNNYSYQAAGVPSALNVPEALSAAGYNVYAVVTAIGSFSGQSFTASGATLNIYGDANQDANLTFAGIDSTTLAFIGGGAGDVSLGTSNVLLSGSGSTAPSGGDDGFQVTFDQFALTAAGSSYFIAPRPFYIGVYSDGDITDGSFIFNPTASGQLFQFQGEASANFLPEPGALALAGLALLTMGALRRRKS